MEMFGIKLSYQDILKKLSPEAKNFLAGVSKKERRDIMNFVGYELINAQRGNASARTSFHAMVYWLTEHRGFEESQARIIASYFFDKGTDEVEEDDEDTELAEYMLDALDAIEAKASKYLSGGELKSYVATCYEDLENLLTKEEVDEYKKNELLAWKKSK